MVDKWSGLAELLKNLIEKYASDLDVDNMSNTETRNSAESEGNENEIEKIRKKSFPCR